MQFKEAVDTLKTAIQPGVSISRSGYATVEKTLEFLKDYLKDSDQEKVAPILELMDKATQPRIAIDREGYHDIHVALLQLEGMENPEPEATPGPATSKK